MNTALNKSRAVSQVSPDDEGWARVKYELGMRGLRLIDLAEHLGVSKENLYAVKHHRNTELEQKIADFLGLGVHDLWPDRYEKDLRKFRKLTCFDLVDAKRLAALEAKGSGSA